MDVRAWLERCPLVAILRGVQPAEAESICSALEQAGICIVEIPLNSPKPLREHFHLVANLWGPDADWRRHADSCHPRLRKWPSAGGQLDRYSSCEHCDCACRQTGGPVCVPGFFNPTEAFALLEAGADAIKLFPAEVLGPPMLKALRAVLPKSVIVIPVGGVDVHQVAPWMAAGALRPRRRLIDLQAGRRRRAVEVKARTLVAAVVAYRNG